MGPGRRVIHLLDTASEAPNVAYDPWEAARSELAGGMQADYALRVWTDKAPSSITTAAAGHRLPPMTAFPGWPRLRRRQLTTLLRIPFSLLEISDPAATPLQMVAFAVEPEQCGFGRRCGKNRSTAARSAANAQPELIRAVAVATYNWPSCAGDSAKRRAIQGIGCARVADNQQTMFTEGFLESGLYDRLTPANRWTQ